MLAAFAACSSSESASVDAPVDALSDGCGEPTPDAIFACLQHPAGACNAPCYAIQGQRVDLDAGCVLRDVTDFMGCELACVFVNGNVACYQNSDNGHVAVTGHDLLTPDPNWSRCSPEVSSAFSRGTYCTPDGGS